MSDFERARIMALGLLDGPIPPDEQRLRQTVEIAVQAVTMLSPGAEVDVEALVRELEANLNVLVGSAATLTDEQSDHVPWLPERRGSIDWNFSRRYRRFLQERRGWALPTLQSSDDLTDRILGLMEDPGRSEAWDRRGMVVGEVQSGKTSNYIELVCKAVDAGYKFVVILTGTTNSLRAQTQLRFDEGFLGWDTRLHLALASGNRRVGVGTLLGAPLYRAISSTSAQENGDFRRTVASQFNLLLGGDPVIMVVKKNGTVLRNLTRWAKSLSPVGPDRPIPGIPLLVIDDEADFASVNTRPTGTGDDDDPTVVNGRIRELLNTFDQRVYIGYTATPFANIFIFPDQETDGFGRDLFPRNFLVNLPVPSNHVGPTRVFGLPEDPDDDGERLEPLPLIRIADDHHEHIPNSHRADLRVEQLPGSLRRALRAFILTCAARAARSGEGYHNSMLVHVTRFVAVQGRIAELVGYELRDLQNRIRYGDGDSPLPIMDELREMWSEDFVPTSAEARERYPELTWECRELSWEEVRSRLVDSSQRIEVRVINGAAREALDYWDRPDGMSVVAIGGDKLSRGLTLEGLSVSYYLRTSRMYDTLLQMGRWFGYRPGYVDLCRLYTSEELRESYEHITMATEELRQEFGQMADRGMSPREFGLRVRSHPAGLMITAAGKMRNGTRMTVSYSGDITETISFEREPSVNRRNYERFDRFIPSLGPSETDPSGNHVWRRVDGAHVADLLEELVVHPGSRKARGDHLARYIRAQNGIGGVTSWTLALISNLRGTAVELGGLTVGAVRRAQHLPDHSDADTVYRIRRLVSPTDEMIDLTDEQRKRALERTVRQHEDDPEASRHRGSPTRPNGPNIRRVRGTENGLLLLYPLQEPDADGLPFVGFAASFPNAEDDTPVDYVVNSVYWQEELGI